MRILRQHDADLESIERFEQTMAALNPYQPDSPGVIILRHLVREASRPIREVQAAHQDPANHLPVLPEQGAINLRVDQIRQLGDHGVGVLIKPFAR